MQLCAFKGIAPEIIKKGKINNESVANCYSITKIAEDNPVTNSSTEALFQYGGAGREDPDADFSKLTKVYSKNTKR